MKPELIKTADGSHSLFLKDLDEHYHSVHGAIQESKHVFLQAGLSQFNDKKSISILEIGFGTGLNALLTLIENANSNRVIDYTTLEAFPLDMEVVNELNYVQELNASDYHSIYLQMHESEWETKISLSPNFNFTKIKNTLQQVSFPQQYDLIYFDAFGPRVQPELWTEEIFQKIYNATAVGGMLVTYCAKGEVKRTLKKVGFVLETLPGPPGKREMIRVIKH
jgi:tRNA U34 5-methylaminomethyl-2-thiouridine-forming methyltransferase MnmC